jgi:hypothetical protein
LIAKVFPFTLIGLSLCASLVCFAKRDVRHGIYWLAAAVLNLTVTV